MDKVTNKIFLAIKSILEDDFGVENVTLQSTLASCNVHPPTQVLYLVLEASPLTSLHIPDHVLNQCQTVGDVVELVKQAAKYKAA